MTNPPLQLVTTADGSNTLYNPLVGENYHSRHGALQESLHVFVDAGLKYFLTSQNKKTSVSVLEVGFGTGLNFLLTANYCLENNVNISYVGIESFPLDSSFIFQLGYQQYISPHLWEWFTQKYPLSINSEVDLNKYLNLKVAHTSLLEFQLIQQFDIVYYDAFSAIHQPEMWSYNSIAHACRFLSPTGIFVTYAITGNLKRTLKSLGYSVDKIPGPPGKREMLRAEK